MSATAAYLRRLGIAVPPPPTLDSLALLHRRHLERLPYENLLTMLGRPPSVDAVESLERAARIGRAGYCFHHNGAFELVLRELGYDVTRRHGHVWHDEATRYDGSLNHLALHVAGLPTPANPGGEWWADVGLGDAFREPLPLVAGEHRQDGFAYLVADVRPDGWSFHHDRTGSFAGVEVTSRPTDPATVLAAHAELAAPGSGRFARILVVQRRHPTGTTTLRGCLLVQTRPTGAVEAELSTYDAWRAALVDLGVALADLHEEELRTLHARMWDAHLAWRSADSAPDPA